MTYFNHMTEHHRSTARLDMGYRRLPNLVGRAGYTLPNRRLEGVVREFNYDFGLGKSVPDGNRVHSCLPVGPANWIPGGHSPLAMASGGTTGGAA